jgi:integrase
MIRRAVALADTAELGRPREKNAIEPEANLAAGDLDEVVEVSEELGQPAKQLREDDPVLFEVVLRIDRKPGLGAVSRPQAAGIPHFHPHDLRHRRISLWHHQGIPARQLAERAGHSRPSMSLDVYSHVLMDETEATPAELLLRVNPNSAKSPD